MALKLSFRFERDNNAYLAENIDRSNAQITNCLHTLLARLDIQTSRVYRPNRNSVKAIFANETELNKVLMGKDTFERRVISKNIHGTKIK